MTADDPMRYASDPARHGYGCAACGQFMLTGIDGLFRNPAVPQPDSAAPHAGRPPTAVIDPGSQGIRPASSQAAAPEATHHHPTGGSDPSPAERLLDNSSSIGNQNRT